MTGQVMFKFSLPCSVYTAKVGAERPATTEFIRYGTRGSGDDIFGTTNVRYIPNTA